MFIEQAREVLYYLVILAGAAALTGGIMKVVDYLDGGNKR